MADDKKTVQFNTPPEGLVGRQLTAQQLETKRRMAARKQQRQPLGGAPEVSIPPLNAEPIDGGGPMSKQAEILRNPASPLSPAYNPQLAQMMQQQEQPQAPRQGPFTPLPPEARQDPRFVHGMGSMIAANQPQLQRDGYRPHISEESKASMQALAEFHMAAQQRQNEERMAAADPGKGERKKAVDQISAAGLDKGALEGEDLYKELQDMLDDPRQWNLLNNPTRRKEIEGRLSAMDITDVIVYGEIRQTVPVVPDKLNITFRSVAAEEDLEVKRMMFGESGGDRYLMDKYTLMQITLAIVSINGDELPSHLNDKKKFDEAKFLDKLDKVSKFPVQLVADIGIQYLWFDERVRKLFLGGTDDLKNS